MSLRKKIILLFLGLAVTPLMILAAVSYWQARTMLRGMVEDQLRGTATMVSQALDSATNGILGELETVSAGLGAGSSGDVLSALGREDGPGSAGGVEEWLGRAAYVRYREPAGSIKWLVGSVPQDGFQCDSEGGSRVIEISVPVPSRGLEGKLTAGFWASDLVSLKGRAMNHAVLVSSGNEVSYATDCDQVVGPIQAGAPPQLQMLEGRVGDSGTFTSGTGTDRNFVAFVRSPDSNWTVMASTNPGTIFSPVSRLIRIYWLFVLGMAVFTSLAFSLMIGKFTRSLSELARAAEEIGIGELDPWLPVQTSGELGQLTLAFSRMLARIRQMMTKVDQSGRLAVVGQLSAYLAHEIRNPLSSIKLNLQRMMRWAKKGTLPEVCLEPLEISLREVERLSASVTGVLELSRAQDGKKEIISLHELVREAAGLLSTKFRRQRVELVLDLDAAADRALARAGQIKSIILNLMVNALEAQPGGGRLEVRSHLSSAPGLRVPVVALHFRDAGQGVPPEIRDRIFEPFFTTKSGGSGIGLAMAAQAARDNGGELYLEPSPLKNSGAEFVVVFPIPALSDAAVTIPEDELPNYIRSPTRWTSDSSRTGERIPGRTGVPAHLMTPEGLEAVLALTISDPEDVN